jgi:hypothetical protein
MSLRMREVDVTLIRGEPRRWARRSVDGGMIIFRFCATCGTRLWHEPAGSGFLRIKPGTLDDSSNLAPRFEAWTKRKATWLTITGLEASFYEQPPSRRPTT